MESTYKKGEKCELLKIVLSFKDITPAEIVFWYYCYLSLVHTVVVT